MLTNLHEKNLRKSKFDLTKNHVARKSQSNCHINQNLLDISYKDSILKDYLDYNPQIKNIVFEITQNLELNKYKGGGKSFFNKLLNIQYFHKLKIFNYPK